jgi:hypothetical protein
MNRINMVLLGINLETCMKANAVQLEQKIAQCLWPVAFYIIALGTSA